MGACSPGGYICTNNGGTYSQSCDYTGPTAEICNGEDDDCDGVDDNVPGLGINCCPDGIPCGIGECTFGQQVCSGNALVCSGAQGITTETCDTEDDDCDGVVDDVEHNGNTNGDTCCLLAGSGGSICNTGVCTNGTWLCPNFNTQATTLTCQNEIGPSTEICNNQDTDCDGVDDNVATLGDPCCKFGSLCGTGICEYGSLVCDTAQSTDPVCDDTGTGPITEICNGVDDDCDGDIDENVPGLPGG